MKRLLLPALCAAAMIVAVTACGSGEQDRFAVDTLGDTVAEAVMAAGSSHVEAGLTAPAVQTDWTADEAFDGPALEDIAGEIAPARASIDDAPSRLVAGWLYRPNNFPQAPDFLQPWLKVDPRQETASGLSPFVDYLGPGPLAQLLRSATTVRDRGEGSVDGTSAHRYQVGIPAVTAMAGLGLSADELKGRGVPDTIQTDLWLDDEGRPVVFVLDAGASMYVKLHFSGWGEDVHVQAPPQSDVYDLSH